MNGTRSSFPSSMRNRLIPNTARVGGRTMRATRIRPGTEKSRAKRRSLRRSRRRETRPAPRLSAALPATAMRRGLPPSVRFPRSHGAVVYNPLSREAAILLAIELVRCPDGRTQPRPGSTQRPILACPVHGDGPDLPSDVQAHVVVARPVDAAVQTRDRRLLGLGPEPLGIAREESR